MTEPLSIGQFGQVVTRHWVLILSGLLLGGVIGFAVTRFMTPVYTATAIQLVKGVPGSGAAANYEAAQYAISRAKSYPAFIYSLPVLEGVRGDMGSAEDIIELRKELSATNPIDTPLVRISATAPTPQLARDKANSAARHMAQFTTQIETVAGKSPISVATAVQAGLPTEPTSPKTLLVAALGAMVGLVLAVGASLIHAYAAKRRQVTRPKPEFDSALDESSGRQASDLVTSLAAGEEVTRHNLSETEEPIEPAALVIGDTTDPNEAIEVVRQGDFSTESPVAAESAKGAVDVTKLGDAIEAVTTDTTGAADVLERVEPINSSEAVKAGQITNIADGPDAGQVRKTTDSINSADAFEMRAAGEPAAELEAVDSIDASNAAELSETVELEAEPVEGADAVERGEAAEVAVLEAEPVEGADAVERGEAAEVAAVRQAADSIEALNAGLPEWIPPWWIGQAELTEVSNAADAVGADDDQPQTRETSSAGKRRSRGTRVSAKP